MATVHEIRDPSGSASVSRRRRLRLVALAGEGALAIAALVWIVERRLSVRRGDLVSGVAIGGVTAALFAALNYYVLRHAPDVPGVGALRRVHDSIFRPLFADIAPLDVAVISIAAGVGEELLFRGAMQQEFGLVPASVAFGLMHFGGGGTAVFGLWAGALGLVLGVVAIGTGGLVAPVVAHVLYDAAALVYIRWGGGATRSPCSPEQ